MRAVDNVLLMFVVSEAAFIIDDHQSPGVSWDKTPMSVSRQLSTGSEKTFLVYERRSCSCLDPGI